MPHYDKQEPTSLGDGWKIKKRKTGFRSANAAHKTSPAQKPTPTDREPNNEAPSWLINSKTAPHSSNKKSWLARLPYPRIILSVISIGVLIIAAMLLLRQAEKEDQLAAPIPTTQRQLNANLGASEQTKDPDLVVYALAMDTMEQTGELDVHLKLSATAKHPVHIDYKTLPRTAEAGTDFMSSHGIVTIDPGDISATFTISIVDDEEIEQDETFGVLLSVDPTLAELRNHLLWGNIVDDDRIYQNSNVAAIASPVSAGLAQQNERLGKGGPLDQQRPAETPKRVQSSPEVEVAAITPNTQPREVASPHYRVQIGALPSKSAAERFWAESQQELVKLITADTRPYFEPAQSANGPVYRLQIGSFQTRNHAVDLCTQLEARSVPCFVVAR